MAATTGLPNAVHPFRALDLIPTPADGIPTHAADLDQGPDSTPAALERQQAHKPPAIFLIQRRQYPIDGTVLFGGSAVRMPPAMRTSTTMNPPPTFLSHDRSLWIGGQDTTAVRLANPR